MSQTVYLNGEILPLHEARISVLDRGFLFGDGVYEVIPVYALRPFRLHEHLRRLQDSLDGIQLHNPLELPQWLTAIEAVISAQPFADQWVYIQVTRGPGPRDHAFPAIVQPTVFIMSNELTTPGPALRESGVAAVTAVDNRWLRCDLKTTSLLANVLLRQQSVDAGAAETLLLRDGQLIEGSVSSIFIVSDGVIRAPAKSNLMLPGITYDVVLDICQRHDLPLHVGPISEAELRAADEVWLTSSSREVLPITLLDGQPVGSGRPGPLFARVYAFYQQFKQSEMYGGQ